MLLLDVHAEMESVDASDDILKANGVLEEANQELQDQEDVNGRLALLQQGLHCE